MPHPVTLNSLHVLQPFASVSFACDALTHFPTPFYLLLISATGGLISGSLLCSIGRMDVSSLPSHSTPDFSIDSIYILRSILLVIVFLFSFIQHQDAP